MMSLMARCIDTYAQVKTDSVEKVSVTKKAFRSGIKLISTNPGDTIVGERSAAAYAQFAGRIVRNIYIDRIGFEKSIYDTAKRVEKTVSTIANNLHVNTREKTIRQHLFFEKNRPLNPHRLADNERFLRDRDFILDSRIVVVPVEGTDSVDVTVVTRDVFSLGATFGGSLPSAPKVGLYDANVDGRGQRIEFTALLDQDRTPHFGYSLLYRKSSIFGSLANVELGYTQLNTGYSIGDEIEYAAYTRIDRPLVSPYSRWAGGVELSRNWSKNVYAKEDSLFLDYRYNLFDSWIGYNIGINKPIENRMRHFLAIRYFDGYYLDPAEQAEARQEIKYNSGYGVLSEISVFKQNFYKTRYVFGFGRTEDIPAGFSVGVTGGYLRLIDVERPYASLKFNYGQASRKGNFYRLLLQVGGFVRKSGLEDVVVQAGATYFTRLLHMNRFKMRSLVSATYTQITNQVVLNWLDINKTEIPGFRTDSLEASKRLAVHLESVLFTPLSLLGFRMAPFAAVDVVPVHCLSCENPADVFWGFSAGLRTRNENLIFGTLEVKLTFIPSDEYGESMFVFGFKQNLRVKNTGTFAQKPSLIAYNQRR